MRVQEIQPRRPRGPLPTGPGQEAGYAYSQRVRILRHTLWLHEGMGDVLDLWLAPRAGGAFQLMDLNGDGCARIVRSPW